MTTGIIISVGSLSLETRTQNDGLGINRLTKHSGGESIFIYQTCKSLEINYWKDWKDWKDWKLVWTTQTIWFGNRGRFNMPRHNVGRIPTTRPAVSLRAGHFLWNDPGGAQCSPQRYGRLRPSCTRADRWLVVKKVVFRHMYPERDLDRKSSFPKIRYVWLPSISVSTCISNWRQQE
jgi:hypothetical protein